jgi:hypothetical protein
MERPWQRVTVLWNTQPTPVHAIVQAAASDATLLTASGASSAIQAQSGELRVLLSGARSDTEPRDAGVRLVGGRPVIVVEELSAGARPSVPPRVAPAERFSNGFSAASAQFQEYLNQNGGTDSIGQPISREFDLLGSPTQIFQRRVLQLGDDGSVRTLSPEQLRINTGSDQNIGEVVRSVLTGQGLSAAHESSNRDSPALRQYDQSQSHGMRNVSALPRSNLKYAFEAE